MRKSMKAVVAVVCLLGIQPLTGCSGDDDSEEEVVECCMLVQLASHCDSYNASEGLKEAVRDWRDVGNSGDGDACKAMINSEDNGCSGPTLDYDERDAIVDCN
jgi:hypothetical protein